MNKRITEAILAFCALSWGIWLLFPFDTCTSAPTFTFFCRIAPEWVWGSLMASGGSVLCWGIFRGGDCRIRRAALMLLSITWFVVWITFLIGNWRSTAAVNYLWWFVLCVNAYLGARNSNGSTD